MTRQFDRPGTFRDGGRSWRRTLLRAACAVSLFALDATSVHAQCALQVRPRSGETGYRKRNYACEGMYVQLQAATINIQVVSLVKGGLKLPDSARTVYVHIPQDLGSLRDSVGVFGRGREANLNWALDGFARPGRPMAWNLEAVVREVEIDVSRLGVFAETRRSSGLGGPIYVPVALSDLLTPPTPGTLPTTVELVIRVPAAGTIQYRMAGGEWLPELPLRRSNGDGYFSIMLEPTQLGPTDVELRWSPSNSLQPGAPESLNIFFW